MPKGQCVFCGTYAGGKGEHVLPGWLLERWDGQGPYTIERNGVPLARRSGATERENLARVTLPVCGSDSPSDCNGWLNTTFEVPAKPHVRSFLDGLGPVTGADVYAVARWAAKTLLLSCHPRAVNSEIVNDPPRSWELPRDLLSTMRRTSQLPADLSLWAAVVDPKAPPTRVPPFDTFGLPRVIWEDGTGGTSDGTTVGFGLSNNAMVVFQLVFHPLVDIEHPLEAAGLVTKLWPQPPAQLDLPALPLLDTAAHQQWGQAFAPTGGAIILPTGERWSRETMARYSSS